MYPSGTARWELDYDHSYDLPAVDYTDTAARHPARTAWWELDYKDRYLWDHLIEHLIDAGRRDDAAGIAGDLRWVGARLMLFGPAAPAADLAAIGTPQAIRLRTVLAREAHCWRPLNRRPQWWTFCIAESVMTQTGDPRL